jgi:nucleoside-diphosphate-sugar epimerase
MAAAMRILVTGAAGYIGSALVRALPVGEVLGTDQSAGPQVQVTGNIAYPQFARSLVTRDIEAVFHLASLVSGGAEQNFELGTKVNLDATRDLLEACRLSGHRPKFVFASSIAVYGGVDDIDDRTAPAPRLSYGAQKLVCEILIDDYTRRGYVDGRALRLPTVMVRPGSANTAVSGWTSALVREPLAGRDYVCPVAPHTRMACISLGKVVAAFLHASAISAQQLGAKRTLLLTGIPASAQQIWEAVRPSARGKVSFSPDPVLQPIMDAAPKSTDSARARSLGFPQNRSVDEIVDEYKKNHSDPAFARNG